MSAKRGYLGSIKRSYFQTPNSEVEVPLSPFCQGSPSPTDGNAEGKRVPRSSQRQPLQNLEQAHPSRPRRLAHQRGRRLHSTPTVRLQEMEQCFSSRTAGRSDH